jgi:hypothetical protein
MATFLEVLEYLRPGVNFANTDGTLAGIRWDTPAVSAPTQQEVDAAISAMAVPATVTPLQMRLALRQMNLLDQVNAWVQTQPAATQDCWQYASTMPRGFPLIDQAAAALKIDLDALYTLAASLPLKS